VARRRRLEPVVSASRFFATPFSTSVRSTTESASRGNTCAQNREVRRNAGYKYRVRQADEKKKKGADLLEKLEVSNVAL